MHAHLAVARIPEHVRHATAGVAGTRTEGPALNIKVALVEVCLSFSGQEESGLKKQTFGVSDALDAPLRELVSREVFVFLVSLLSGPKGDEVGTIPVGVAVVVRDAGVKVVNIEPDRDSQLPHCRHQTILGQTR